MGLFLQNPFDHDFVVKLAPSTLQTAVDLGSYFTVQTIKHQRLGKKVYLVRLIGITVSQTSPS